MNHNRIPDNDDMARLIATSFDALPGPDEERLEAVRTRLETQLKRPPSRSYGKRWIWLLLLVGGTATAAWWAVGKYMDNQQESVEVSEPVRHSSGTVRPVSPGSADVQPGDSNKHGQPDYDDPVIYQREQR